MSGLGSIGCKNLRCSTDDCCAGVFCSNNDGESAGLTYPVAPFELSTCTDTAAGRSADWTLKTDLHTLRCMAEDKKCRVAECCDPPITCANNDGSSSGLTGSAFDSAGCTNTAYGGGVGFTLKGVLTGDTAP